MDSLIKFGLGSVEAYDFVPQHQLEYQDNFADIMQQTVRVPGKDGGISTFGMGRGPAEVGNVRVSFWVFGDSIADVGHRVSRVREMAYWGLRRLFKLHQNGELMWTWASVSSLQAAQVVRRRPHVRQQVQMTFQCPESKWYTAQGMLFLNDGHTFGDALVFPPLKVDEESVSNGSTVSVTNRGNAPVSAFVRWAGDGSNTMVNPVLTRRNWVEEIVNQLSWSGSVGATDIVEIDATKLSCTDRSSLTTLSGDWLTIPSGTWDLEVGMSSGQGLLTVDFWDGWV